MNVEEQAIEYINYDAELNENNTDETIEDNVPPTNSDDNSAY